MRWNRVKIRSSRTVVLDGYRSEDGRWTIVKTEVAARNGCWKTAWNLFDGERQIISFAETMRECKEFVSPSEEG